VGSGRSATGDAHETLGRATPYGTDMLFGVNSSSEGLPILRSEADDAGNTKASRLVERLREAIISGSLAPGTKINLDRVRREFGVSLSPLREALARLLAFGLVELHDNRGYSVAPVSLNNLAEITRLRVEFESLALSSAITSGDLRWESEVMRALHLMNRMPRDPADLKTLEAWEHAHRDFHMALLAGCRMPLLLSFCLVLHNLNDRYRRTFLAAQGGDRNVVVEHSEIAQGAVARDRDYACDKLREHIQRTGANLRTRLSDQLKP
jgi:DNA-binding GntR family transcriptional regulator